MMMPLQEARVRQTTKRKRVTSTEVAPTPDPPPQSPKGRKELPYLFSRPTPKFWDHLSRVWLTPFALQEFDRRTVQLIIPKPKCPSDFKGDSTKELKYFARQGGPSLCDLRGYAEAELRRTMNSRRPQASAPTRQQVLLTPYDANYEQYLVNNLGVSLHSQIKPKNLGELKTRLRKRRPSLHESRFSEQDFENLKQNNEMAKNSVEAMANVFPVFKGSSAIFSYQKRNFMQLDEKLAAAMPDLYDGSHPENLDLRVQDELGNLIAPCTDLSSPLLPNFFFEIHGIRGESVVLRRQLTRDLLYGAHGTLAIQSYSNGDREFDGNAYTIGALYSCEMGVLRIYTMFPTEPADPTGNPMYQMYQVKSFFLTEDAETCRDAITWFRNARDFAKDVRDGAIASANKGALDRHNGAPAPASTNQLPVSSSTNGVSGLVPGSWLGGPPTPQAQDPPTTGDTASKRRGTGHEEPVNEPSDDAGPL